MEDYSLVVVSPGREDRWLVTSLHPETTPLHFLTHLKRCGCYSDSDVAGEKD